METIIKWFRVMAADPVQAGKVIELHLGASSFFAKARPLFRLRPGPFMWVLSLGP